ncbi:acyl-CoA thioesterase [Ulvibacter antarcticus]|uniref:Acyl-CoA thioester hydrolase n=1 Tax=Ulvibacter antarcticus TaxID=442714 RepID=A0A3L9ZDX3_9FLAO|nr:acyl-CoA thioesterase [Ulvibacter antarcticus]RMA64872.1 acyl-CoA thioester hydrolase [Ulvibacter antarcticus]
MNNLPKVLESKTKIRFQDCDPFNHLNNVAYLNYLINAREDQVNDNYGIDIYEMARKQGKSWVVGSNQIAYLKPAFLMEEVVIQTQLLKFNETELLVELKMLNADKTEVKAIMWSTYVHFNLLKQKREIHTEDLTTLYNEVVVPVDTTIFENRVASFKKQKV